ncbi:MAG: hypothetical protein, partial [Olavius algarvensis Gamma 1 endosymbiont]
GRKSQIRFLRALSRIALFYLQFYLFDCIYCSTNRNIFLWM